MKSAEVINKCRKVDNPTVELPTGYYLYDDEHFVYLIHGEEVVGTFNAYSVDPNEIVIAAEKHQG